MGSKFAVIIILIAMIFLAGRVGSVPLAEEKDREGSPFETYRETQDDVTVEDFTFENFPIEGELYNGALAAVDFSTYPLARSFERIISRGAVSSGVNFAKHYSVISWSCGNLCQNSTIVDARNGAIVEYGIISSHGLSFSPESTLLIINPPENIENIEDEIEPVTTDYYVMEENGLVLLGKEVGGNTVRDDCIEAFVKARNSITNEEITFSKPCKIPFGWEIID